MKRAQFFLLSLSEKMKTRPFVITRPTSLTHFLRFPVIGLSLLLCLAVLNGNGNCQWVDWKKKMVCKSSTEQRTSRNAINSELRPLSSVQSFKPKSKGGIVTAALIRKKRSRAAPTRTPPQPHSISESQNAVLGLLMTKAKARISDTQSLWGDPSGPSGWSWPSGLVDPKIRDATSASGRGILSMLLRHRVEVDDGRQDEGTEDIPSANNSRLLRGLLQIFTKSEPTLTRQYLRATNR